MKAYRDLVGVDIGSSSVKAVQLQKAGHAVELVNVGIAELSPDAIVDGAIMDTLAVSSAIANLFAENNFSTRNVAAAVSGSAVMVKRITVAAGSDAQLAEAMPAEAQRQLSCDPEELDLDYQVLGPAAAPNAQEVMLVAARREKVSAYTGVLSQAERVAQLIDVDAFAVQNAFEAAYHPGSEPTFALLNVGASLMNVNIVRDGTPLFTRDVPFGGQQITEALQRALDLSFAEAEKVKAGVGSAQVNVEARDAALATVSQSLVAEMRGTLNFFRQMTGVSDIERIYLSGGTARLAGLAERMERELGSPVEVLDPLRGISLKASEFDSGQLAAISPRLAVAVGLALRSFDGA